MTVLTGDELKAKAAEMRAADATEDAVAVECGYVNAAGKPKLAAFRAALNEALGLSFAKPVKPRKARAGKPLSYRVTAGKTGSIMLAAGYGARIGVGPGDAVTIAEKDGGLFVTTAPADAAPVVVTPF